MLVGPNAAIVFDRKVRSTYMANVYDFYKPDLTSEYPYVDGPLSNQCYLQALDQCYNLYFDKVNRAHASCPGAADKNQTVQLEHFDGILFHAPYCKLVQKSVARMYLLNGLRKKTQDPTLLPSQLEKYRYVSILSLGGNFPYTHSLSSCLRNVKLEDSYNDRELEKLLLGLSTDIFSQRTDPSLMLAREIGNMYTASLYACLISYLLRCVALPPCFSTVLSRTDIFFPHNAVIIWRIWRTSAFCFSPTVPA